VQQLRETFPEDGAPRYLVLDHDTKFETLITLATARQIVPTLLNSADAPVARGDH
jgi:hypothetical protein